MFLAESPNHRKDETLPEMQNGFFPTLGFPGIYRHNLRRCSLRSAWNSLWRHNSRMGSFFPPLYFPFYLFHSRQPALEQPNYCLPWAHSTRQATS